MTAISLADLVGVTRQAISQYEQGVQSPAPEVMKRIAEALNLPVYFFLRRRTGPEPDLIFYRSMSSATKEARSRAERRYEWLRDLVAYLRQWVEFPESKVPDLGPKDDPRSLTDADIENAATQLRRSWGLKDGPISNVVLLAENNGAVVGDHELGARELDAFSEWREGDDRPFIVLGKDKGSAVRSRFDLAHELGHMVLHRHLRPAVLSTPQLFRVIEDQAHRFASAFLLPATTFSSEVTHPSLTIFEALKSRWKVSIAAMICRSEELGFVEEDQGRRLWINLTRRGWKYNEPLDDVIEYEEPRLIRRAIELLRQAGQFNIEEFTFHLGLTRGDLEQVAGLPPGLLQESKPSPTEGMNDILRFPGHSGGPSGPDVR